MSEPQRRFRLRTVGGCLTEVGRLYKAAWNGDLSWQDAAAGARIVREARVTIEGTEIEQRLVALEQRLGCEPIPQVNGRHPERRPWPH